MTILVFVLSLLGAMALGMPIAFTLIVCALALMWAQGGAIDMTLLSQKFVEGADSYPLLAIPFFVLAGAIMAARMAVVGWVTVSLRRSTNLVILASSSRGICVSSYKKYSKVTNSPSRPHPRAYASTPRVNRSSPAIPPHFSSSARHR